jgi:hypothetical protein
MKLRSGRILVDKTVHVAALMRAHVDLAAMGFGVEERLLGIAALYKCVCAHFDLIYTHDSFIKIRGPQEIGIIGARSSWLEAAFKHVKQITHGLYGKLVCKRTLLL